MVEKILNNTTPYGKIRASHEGTLHSSTLRDLIIIVIFTHIQNTSYLFFVNRNLSKSYIFNE